MNEWTMSLMAILCSDDDIRAGSKQIKHLCSKPQRCSQEACIDTFCDSGTSRRETYYSNFIAVICTKMSEVQEESILAARKDV